MNDDFSGSLIEIMVLLGIVIFIIFPLIILSKVGLIKEPE